MASTIHQSLPTGSTTGANTRPPYPCSDGTTFSGYCPGGMDVTACEAGLDASCATGTVLTELFMDSCGGARRTMLATLLSYGGQGENLSTCITQNRTSLSGVHSLSLDTDRYCSPTSQTHFVSLCLELNRTI